MVSDGHTDWPDGWVVAPGCMLHTCDLDYDINDIMSDNIFLS